MEAADRGYGFDQHHSAPDSSEIKKNRLLVPRLVLPANNGDAGVDKPNSSSTTSASTYARQIRPANTALNRPSTAKKRPSTASSSSSNNNKGNNSANGVVVLKDSMSMRGSVNTRYSGNTDDEFGDNDSFILEDNNRIDDDDDFINESLEAAHKARLSRQKAHQQQQKTAQKPSSSRSTSLSRTSSISTNMSTATRSPGLTASMKPLSARSRIQKVYGIDMTTPRTAEYAIQHRIVKTSSTSSVNSISISTEPQQHQEQQQQQHQPLTVPPSAATKKKETQPQPQQQQQQAQVVPQQQHKPASASAARPRSSGPTTFIYKNGKVNPYLQPQRLVHKSRSRPATSKSSNSSNSNNKANNHASSKQIRPHRPHSARFEAAEELNDNDFIAEDNDTEYHPIDDIRAEVSHNYNNNNNDSDIMSITDEDMPPSQRLEVLEQQIASLQQHQQRRRRRPDQESRIVALQVEKIALTKLLHGEFSVPSVQAVLELSRTYLELGAYDPCLMHAEKALKMNQNVALALSTASSSSSNNNRLKVPTRPSSSGKATRVPTPKRVNGDDAASRQQQELERVRLLRVSQELTPTILSTIAMAQYQQRDYTAALATLKHALKLNSEITSLSPSDDSTDAGTDETVDTGRSSSSTRGTGSNGSSSSSSRFSILMGLGKVSAAAGQYDQAVDYLEQAWEVKEAEDSRSTDLASVYSELGRVKALMGQFENAVEMYNQAMRIMEADAKTNQTTYNRKSIGNLCCILVDLYSKLEDYESALPLARKSFEILNVSDEDIEEFLDRHRGHDDQTPDEEIRRQRQRQHLRQQHEDASPVTELSQLQQAISVQITLGFVMVKCSEFTEACSVLERAMDLIERWDSNNEDSSPVLVAPLQKAHTYKMLGTVYLALKKGEEALRAYKKAVSIYGKHLGGGGGGSSADKPNSVSSNSVFYETVGPLIDRITDLEKYLKHKEWQASSGLDASSGLTARLFGTRIDEEGESHNEGTEDESKISDNCDEEEDSSNNDNDNNGEEDEEEEDNSSYASLIIKDSPRGSSYGDDPAGDDDDDEA